jgi:hypothetical protein
MSAGIDRLLADVEQVDVDDLAADACDWLAAAIARGVDISPRLAAIVMHYGGVTGEHLRHLVARHQQREQLIHLVQAGRSASRRLDVAHARAERAREHLEHLAHDVERAMRAGEQARDRLLHPDLLTTRQAEQLQLAATAVEQAEADLHAATDEQRMTQLRLVSLRDQVQAASAPRARQTVAVATHRQQLDACVAQQARQAGAVHQAQQRLRQARAAHDQIMAELLGDAA